MQEEMERDPGKKYWLDDPEMKESNFRGIREDQALAGPVPLSAC